MTPRWSLRPVSDAGSVDRLARELNDLPLPLARALVLRGIASFEDARRFFRPSVQALHDPFSMKDMDKAAARVAAAIQQGERVVVYGDYDVDGTTSTALFTHFLRTQGVKASYFVPNRFKHGYGLCNAGLDWARAQGATLVVALDCGVTAIAEALYARQIGLDLVICDHHKVDGPIPDAYAVLDPKRPDCPYPFKELSGCGIGYKLVQAVLTVMGRSVDEALPYLDLVAVSTAADIVPLYGENRDLMAAGVERLRHSPRVGLAHLADMCRTDLTTATTENIVFTLGPRINAAGRMGDAGRAVELLLTESSEEAFQLALDLEEINQKRRDLDQETQQEASKMAEKQLSAWAENSVVLYRPDWHLGVIGIVASRMVEKYYRPSIMMCSVGGYVKGSARSIHGISIYNALKACGDLLDNFGGHDYAAGLTLKEENVPAFQRRFDEAVGNAATPELMEPTTDVDALLDLGELDDRFWAVLRQFAPHGPTNLTPVFQAEDLEIVGQPKAVGREGAHLKFAVRQKSGQGEARDVIAFRMGKHLTTLLKSQREGTPLELVFTVDENTFRGQRSIQLKARDLRGSDKA